MNQVVGAAQTASAPGESSLALVCKGLSKRFGTVQAADRVDLKLAKGQVLALLGPSGCGKTTILRLIAGFEVPDEGTVTVDGQVVVGNGTFAEPEKRRVGLVFQDYALFPHLTVAGNVAFGLPRGLKDSLGKKRVDDLLALVGLEGLGDRYPHQLSGGQQQRVALARALAPEPALLLFDEPFSNLDAGLRARVRAEVRQILALAGTSAIFVTHDQDEALSLADEVAVMWQGRIVQTASPEELYWRPANREVATFVGEANILPGTARGSAVTCELGMVLLCGVADGEVEVVIRPELISLRANENGPGVVLAREFYGHDQMFTIRLDSGTIVRARLGPEIGPRPGQRVGLKVRGAIVCFPRSTS